MKKYFILSISALIIIFTGCDGLLAVRGYVIDDISIMSHIVSDSLFNSLQLSKGIEGVFIQIDPAVEDSLMNQENLEKYGFKTFTDSIGYFEYTSSFAPSIWDVGIIASKDGFINDTIYFTNNLEQINLIIHIKKIN
jgi:hypothetical protein